MCATCGCSDGAGPSLTDLADGSVVALVPDHHDHEHSHHHDHDHPTNPDRIVRLEADVLARNDRLASENRTWLSGRNVLAVNLMSSPGAGKTTVLERTIRDLGSELSISVVEGDQETLLDAERIRAADCRVVQINTGSGCHLDASMLGRGLEALDPQRGSVVMIENVGNLVCPALFDLGEHARVVIMSVPEGEDKPLKYPHMFRSAALMLLNKIDLAPYVDFDLDRCVAAARRVNPEITIITVSATRGDGLDAWYGWLRDQRGSPPFCL